MPIAAAAPSSHICDEELALAAADLEHRLAAQVVPVDPAVGELCA